MKKIVTTLAMALLGIFFVACSEKQKQKTNTAIDESAVAIQLAQVQTVDYSLPVISSGLISTETESKLSFKAGGIITKIHVKEGEPVSRGQLLASLDLTEIDALVAQAKNNLDKTQRDLERGKRLLKDSAATLEQIQNLTTAFNVAEEGYRIASFNRQFSTIRANTSGKVIRKFVNEGELIGPGTPVLMINSSGQNDWIVKIGLPDVDWARVKKGDAAKITTDAYPADVFNGELTVINEGAEATSGLYQAEVQVNATTKKLASGLFARVQITPSSRKKLQTVPIESIVEGQGKNAFVFVVNEDKKSVKKLPIVIAYLENKTAFVLSGLDSIKKVVAGGSAFLTENSTVKIDQQ
ncbi:MAG TPA: efflux RND transporter periplasmic adaptor subunit [Cyclobacteriaceae bacterium]|jgi:RND family efflux transporter MFP subunit|nr:efflux RND transporter periplasmic adaptor subunit [Cyclobacteriaceae bacterium]